MIENTAHSPVDVSIVIVNYKTPQLLLECIQSIQNDTTGLAYEIIVVDNFSEDASKQLITSAFPSVRWFDVDYNSGFSRGNNMGMRQAKGAYVLLLNSDTIVKNNLIHSFYTNYIRLNADGKLGLLGCRILSSVDGSLLIGSGRGYWNIWRIWDGNPAYILWRRLINKPIQKKYDAYHMHYANHEVDFVSGACVMLEMKKIKENDLLLDEDFFLYYEDVEWSFRTKKWGFRNWFCADMEVYHINAGSSKTNSLRDKQIQLSSYLFLRKRYGALLYFMCGFLYFLNFKMNGFLLKRKNITTDWQENKAQYHIWKRYYGYVFSVYKKRPSSNKTFLKYAEQNF